MKDRSAFVDDLKGISILLVVLAHINFANQGIRAWTHGLVIQVFFFAAGFMIDKSAPSSGAELRNEICRKFRRLMIPYYLWAAIFAAYSWPNLLYIIYASYNALDRSGSLTPLWFLPVLFVCVVLYLLCQYLMRDRFTIPIKLGMTVICFVTAAFLPKFEFGYPMGINVAVAAFGFLLLGNICFPLLRKYEEYAVHRTKLTGGLSAGAVTVISAAVGGVLCRLNSSYAETVLMADARYGHYGLFLLGAIVGTVCLCAAAFFFEWLPLKCVDRVLGYLGQNTFAVYVLHKPVINIMKTVFRPLDVPKWVALIATCTVAVAVSCVVNLLIKQYAPVLLGQSGASRDLERKPSVRSDARK